MRDLARAANVNASTVSRALRDDPRLLPATRRRIRALAADLGYRHEPAFGILADKRWGREAPAHRCNLAWLDFGGVHPMLASLRDSARRLSYGLEFLSVADHPDAARLDAVLQARGVHGIFFPALQASAPPLPALPWQRYAVVACSVDFHHPPFHIIRPDVSAKVLGAWRKCIEKGYSRIGVALPTDSPHELDIERIGVCMYLEQATRTGPLRVPVWRGRYSDKKDFARWLHRHRPDVLIGHGVSMLGWLAAAAMTVPDDLGFVALVVDPGENRVAGFDSQPDLLGREAVHMMDGLIRRNETGIPSQPLTVLIPPRWVEGTTLPIRQVAVHG